MPRGLQRHTGRKIGVGANLLVGVVAGAINVSLLEPLDTLATAHQARPHPPSSRPRLQRLVFSYRSAPGACPALAVADFARPLSPLHALCLRRRG